MWKLSPPLALCLLTVAAGCDRTDKTSDDGNATASSANYAAAARGAEPQGSPAGAVPASADTATGDTTVASGVGTGIVGSPAPGGQGKVPAPPNPPAGTPAEDLSPISRSALARAPFRPLLPGDPVLRKDLLLMAG
ncbi:MAG: hypothetical protein KC416_07825, partial [Myxococcales bacterium]|nr:hypothetical protein [Myxococcales bacterium]